MPRDRPDSIFFTAPGVAAIECCTNFLEFQPPPCRVAGALKAPSIPARHCADDFKGTETAGTPTPHIRSHSVFATFWTRRRLLTTLCHQKTCRARFQRSPLEPRMTRLFLGGPEDPHGPEHDNPQPDRSVGEGQIIAFRSVRHSSAWRRIVGQERWRARWSGVTLAGSRCRWPRYHSGPCIQAGGGCRCSKGFEGSIPRGADADEFQHKNVQW